MSVESPLIPAGGDVTACSDWPRSIVQTSCGPVEYAERGAGMALLAVHGTPGGCHQGLAFADFFRANGFRVIAPSRPGYLNTPVDSGRTPQEQADLLAALLDELGVERAGVLGVSGGGPASYTLAARHPDRVSCLLQMSAISQPWTPARAAALQDRILMSRFGNWLFLWLFDNRPSLLGRLMSAAAEGDAPALPQEPFGRELLRCGIASFRQRPVGYDNDTTQYAQLAPLPLAAIGCPTLVVHGTADRDVEPAHAQHAAAEILGAETHWIDQGTHLAAFVEDDVESYRICLEWLSEHCT